MAEDGKARARATWGASPTGWRSAGEHEVGTQAFFEKALDYRMTHEIPWLADAIPFHTMAEKRVLEIGFGPGFDAFTFISNGALYKGVDITPENVDRARKHLGYYGIIPDVQEGDAEKLPFDDNSFDVVYSNGVLHHVPDIELSFKEVNRVLRPGGIFYVILYNKNSLFFRLTISLWYQIVLGGRRFESLSERLSTIEANAAGERPIVNVYTPKEVSNLLERAGLMPTLVIVRKLTWEDLPALPLIWRAYRFIPSRLLNWLGTFVGWYVIGIAKKPVL